MMVAPQVAMGPESVLDSLTQDLVRVVVGDKMTFDAHQAEEVVYLSNYDLPADRVEGKAASLSQEVALREKVAVRRD